MVNGLAETKWNVNQTKKNVVPKKKVIIRYSEIWVNGQKIG